MLQRAWLREFNAVGLQLRPQAAKVVTNFLQTCMAPQAMAEALVENTKAYLSQRGIAEAIIDGDIIKAVIACMEDASKDAVGESVEDAARQGLECLDLGDSVQVYNVMSDVPPFDYQWIKGTWATSAEQPKLLPCSDVKAKIYIDRYHLLLQRLLLDGNLVMEAEATVAGLRPGQRVLTPVESLVGNPGRKLTFGLISRMYDETARRWAIEDLHKVYRVELDVTESDHLMTDGSFVLADGELVGDHFRIHHLDVPAAVPRSVTDLSPQPAFGGSLTSEQLDRLRHLEPENPEGMLVVLCEVHLDSARVLEKLSQLFQGYEETTPPVAYVFMGSFSSSACVPASTGVEAYRNGFERLKFMLRGLTNHVRHGTRFVFIPGPDDPGAKTLPRVPLTGYLTSDIAKEIPGVTLATNPCRVRYFTRELVFFRHDVLRLLRRHEVVPLRVPSAQDVRKEMVRFLLDQAHLVPLPLEESNVLWAFDHTLRLHPLPHAVFVGGVGQPFECSYQQCTFCSVAPFHRSASFYAYHPLKDLLEPCDVPDLAG